MSLQNFASTAVADRRYNKWLNRFAWFICVAALLLICSGGMVTSKNVGLAVPDWPTTFGYNMFLFPVSKWVGGILFEHTHRLIASAVGFLTIILAIWLWRSESRKLVRNLGLIALAGVILQGILGGLRVTMLKDQIGIFHACVAQAFLALLMVIALVTTNFWRSLDEIDISPKKFAPIRRLAIAITLAIYVQLALGATMRHQHRDLSILDFPTANGAWIPDTSATTLAKINAWRDARGLSAASDDVDGPGPSSRAACARSSQRAHTPSGRLDVPRTDRSARPPSAPVGLSAASQMSNAPNGCVSGARNR